MRDSHYSIKPATAAIKLTKLIAPAELKPREAIAPFGAEAEPDAAGLLAVAVAPESALPDDTPVPAPVPAVADGAPPVAGEEGVVPLALLIAAAWNAAKDLSAVGFMAKTMPFWQ